MRFQKCIITLLPINATKEEGTVSKYNKFYCTRKEYALQWNEEQNDIFVLYFAPASLEFNEERNSFHDLHWELYYNILGIETMIWITLV